jgi:hypothetical protein
MVVRDHRCWGLCLHLNRMSCHPRLFPLQDGLSNLHLHPLDFCSSIVPRPNRHNKINNLTSLNINVGPRLPSSPGIPPSNHHLKRTPHPPTFLPTYTSRTSGIIDPHILMIRTHHLCLARLSKTHMRSLTSLRLPKSQGSFCHKGTTRMSLDHTQLSQLVSPVPIDQK